jgi:hypothetical protein
MDKDENKPKEKVYAISFEKNSSLQSQLTWMEDARENLSNSFSKSHDINLEQGSVHEYVKAVNVDGSIIKGLCIILENSNKWQPLAIICPIYKIKNDICLKEGLNIGLIPNYGNSEYIAAIQEIRFIQKKRFLIPGVQKDEVAFVFQNVVFDIMTFYIKLLNKIMDTKFKCTVVNVC